MKKNILILIMTIAYTAIYGQGIDANNFTRTKTDSYNASTGTYNKSNNFEISHKWVEGESSDFDSGCSTDFYTINKNGDIQQWSLANNSISGGDTILGGGGTGLAYCGASNSPTFYSSLYPSPDIKYYDTINGWQTITTSFPVLNNGGHKNDQYYFGEVSVGNQVLYYFDGMNLTTIDSLDGEYFGVADIAVDPLGRAWVFKGGLTSVTSLDVYDKTGLTLSYPITFWSSGAYGSFFLNDTLYVGIKDSIKPIIITGSVAQCGTSISFKNDNFYDMASCQRKEPASTSISELANSDINIFPNPTNGIINLSTPAGIINVEIYDLKGQIIVKSKQAHKIDLTDLPDGMYFMRIITKNGEYNKKIIKR